MEWGLSHSDTSAAADVDAINTHSVPSTLSWKGAGDGSRHGDRAPRPREISATNSYFCKAIASQRRWHMAHVSLATRPDQRQIKMHAVRCVHATHALHCVHFGRCLGRSGVHMSTWLALLPETGHRRLTIGARSLHVSAPIAYGRHRYGTNLALLAAGASRGTRRPASDTWSSCSAYSPFVRRWCPSCGPGVSMR